MEFKQEPNNLSAEKGEILLSKLVIRPQSAEEEVDYLWFVLDSVPFFREHNYTFVIPDHPEFQNLAKIAPDFNGVNREKIRKLFIDEIYDVNFYKPGLTKLETERTRIKSAFPEFIKFNQKWGFKLFPRYDLVLTKYGPGGMYYEDTGKIIMLTTADGNFKRPHPAHTPVHEMVHLGIEKDIVKRFGLTHREKERVVDLIILERFGNILPGYQLQDGEDKRVDSYITKRSLNDLPVAIQQYVRDFPR